MTNVYLQVITQLYRAMARRRPPFAHRFSEKIKTVKVHASTGSLPFNEVLAPWCQIMCAILSLHKYEWRWKLLRKSPGCNKKFLIHWDDEIMSFVKLICSREITAPFFMSKAVGCRNSGVSNFEPVVLQKYIFWLFHWIQIFLALRRSKLHF